jgi:FMN reductase
MGVRNVLAISGSHSISSKTVALVEAVLREISSADIVSEHIAVREIDPVALLSADSSSNSLTSLLRKVDAAHGVIIATPIYKASFSGLLKAALDTMPQFAFAGKVIMPLGTGGSLAHVLALDYGLRPVIQSMAARHIVQSHYVVEQDFPKDGGPIDLATAPWNSLRQACRNFIHSLTDDVRAKALGHPRPEPHPSQ